MAKEATLVYPPVVGWRARVGQTRKKVAPLLVATGITLATIGGAALASKDQIYGAMPGVAEAQAAWLAQDSYTKFLDLQMGKEAFGVNADQELSDATVDLVDTAVRKHGGTLSYSTDDLKSKITWLPERQFIDKYISTYGSQRNDDGRRMAKGSPWLLADVNTIYYNSGYVAQDLRYMGVAVNESTVRAYKVQRVIDRIVELHKPIEHLSFSPIPIDDPVSKRQVLVNQMTGFLVQYGDFSQYHFAETADKLVAQELIGQMPGLNRENYVFSYHGRAIEALRALHQQGGVTMDKLLLAYFDKGRTIAPYIMAIGYGGGQSFETGVRRIIEFSQRNRF